MTPERIAFWRLDIATDNWPAIEADELADLLATAEREAKLREAIETAIDDLIDGDAFVIDRLRAALEQKGGEQ